MLRCRVTHPCGRGADELRRGRNYRYHWRRWLVGMAVTTARLLALGSGSGSDDVSAHYLSVTAQDSIILSLCDGTRSWRGTLTLRDMTPPQGTVQADFFTQVLHGLCQGPADALTLVSSGHGSVELVWVATHDDEDTGITYTLRQAAVLRADGEPSEGLRNLLSNLVAEWAALQQTCAAQSDEEKHVQAQQRELDAIDAFTNKEASTESREARCERLLLQLNRKKRRIIALERALNDSEAGVDGLPGSISPGRSANGDEDALREDDDAASDLSGAHPAAGTSGSVAPGASPASVQTPCRAPSAPPATAPAALDDEADEDDLMNLL